MALPVGIHRIFERPRRCSHGNHSAPKLRGSLVCACACVCGGVVCVCVFMCVGGGCVCLCMYARALSVLVRALAHT